MKRIDTEPTATSIGVVKRARAERNLLAAQVVGSFGLAAGGAGGPLLVADITGQDAMAALPVGLLALGAAALAPLLTKVMTLAGQRAGLIVGYAIAVGSALVILIGAAGADLAIVLTASFALGAGNNAVFLSRYAVARLAQADHRGRALSRSMVASAAGAVAGPNLLGPSADLATPLGLPAEAGLYIVGVVAFAAAGLLLLTVPRSMSAPPSADQTATPRPRDYRIALLILATANAVMVSVMSLAAVEMHSHGHSLSIVGITVSLHVLAMFAGSPIVGRLCDRFGPLPVARVGTLFFAVAGAVGVVGDLSAIVPITGALIALGIGWNVQVVAGSTLLTISLPDRDRFTVEGRGELIMGSAAAFGTLAAAGPLAMLGGLRLVSVATLVATTVTAVWFRPTKR